MSPALAPDFDSAWNRCAALPDTSVMPASKVAPFAVPVASPKIAVFTTSA